MSSPCICSLCDPSFIFHFLSSPSLFPLPLLLPPPSTISQIVVAKLDHTFELDHEALEDILLSDEVRDRKVVVISVAGAFRKGKSFLLDFLIRYLDREVGLDCVL